MVTHHRGPDLGRAEQHPQALSDRYVRYIRIDRAAMTCKPDRGLTLPPRPFFWAVGVAPPPRHGQMSGKEPRQRLGLQETDPRGGDLVRVWVPCANLLVGDGHGRQGGGEVCVNAPEMGLTGTFTFIPHRRGDGPAHSCPRAETPSHPITLGLNEDMDLRQALRGMIDPAVSPTALTRVQAYQLCSLAVDSRVA